MDALFTTEKFERVIHLAAQVGVRYSLQNPHAYIDSNIVGFSNVLEGCSYTQLQHLVYASSASVYGGNTKMPYSEHDSVDHPVSLYAVTKKALLNFIGCIENALGKKAEKILLPLQDGDVPATYANTDALKEWVGFVPSTSIDDGIGRYVAWYRAYYKSQCLSRPEAPASQSSITRSNPCAFP